MRGDGREKKGGEGKGEGRGGGEGRGEEAFLVMWPRRLSPLNPPEKNFHAGPFCSLMSEMSRRKVPFPITLAGLLYSS